MRTFLIVVLAEDESSAIEQIGLVPEALNGSIFSIQEIILPKELTDTKES